MSALHMLIVGTIALSHSLAIRRFWRRLGRGVTPAVADFACASLVLYYDTGLLLEALGRYESPYFGSLLDADPVILAWALTYLVLAPWLFRLGESLFGGRAQAASGAQSRLRPSRRWGFYALVTLGAAPLVAGGVRWLSSGEAVWVLRARLGEQFGPVVILLYVPMYALAFYVRQADSRTRLGRVYSLLLVMASVAATAAYGQRTTVLLPVLILILFGASLTRRRLIMSALACVLAASLLLPVYKWQFAGEELRLGDMIAPTLAGDFARTGVLRKALELSDDVGVQVVPYPFAGYVYSALFFLPRSLAPIKGESTARHFTGHVDGTPLDETNWGFGLGAIEEAALNGGRIATLPLLFVLGCGMGLLQRASTLVPSLVVPTRLGALWCCGYHLPALLLLFGAMLVAVLLLHWMFVARTPTRQRPQTGSEGAGWMAVEAPGGAW
jgi:hypothetical protein